jgi:hypothetical protein
VLTGPSNHREFPPPLRAVTFEVKGLRGEQAGTLGIQFTDADGTVDRTGRFRAEGGVDDYALTAISPGSRFYSVTVPASAFQRYGDKHLVWQAYRLVPPSDCKSIPGSTTRDCFQQSAGYRELSLLEPTGYLNFEPDNTPATATTEFFNSDCAFLEKTNDVDWFRHDGTPKPLNLTVRLWNLGDTDRWKPLGPRSRESADMKATVYRADGMRVVAARHVPVGKKRVLRTRLAANTAHLLAFAHAGNGFPKAKPAANLHYRYSFNFPTDFDFAGCGQ